MIRTIAARAAQKRHQIHQLDVKTAFLYGQLQDEVLYEATTWLPSQRKEGLVCKLHRTLYSLRQSPRMWSQRIDSYLCSLGMTRSNNNYNLYHLEEGDNKIILVVYVDDLFLIGGNESRISWLKQQLHRKFNMTNLGQVKKYLGVEFTQLSNRIFLSQHQYALDMLKEFGMLDCRFEHIPLASGLQLVNDMNSPITDLDKYCKMVGKLIFLTKTPPDLAYAVSSVSLFMLDP
jgi:hypothetical protein